MATSREIGAWFDRGVQLGAKFMIVAIDKFDWMDYPVYVEEGRDPRERANEIDSQRMSRVMECYDLSMDKEAQMEVQMAEHRALHYGEF